MHFNSRLDAFLAEFPFIKYAAGDLPGNRFHVSILGEQVLNLSSRNNYLYLASDEKDAESGGLLTEVGRPLSPTPWYFRLLCPPFLLEQAETVLDAYKRLEEEERAKVRYVLHLSGEITVHRIPRGLTMDELLDKFNSESEKDVANEVKKLDSEAA